MQSNANRCRWALIAAITLAVSAACSAQPSPPATPTTNPAADLPGRIVFTRAGGTFGDETIFTANANGTNERKIADGGATCCPRATRDGRRLLFAAAAGNRITTATMNIDGSDRTTIPLPDTTLNLGPGAWSPNADRIAFEGWDDTDNTRDGIYLARPDGTQLTRLTNADEQRDLPSDFSPDGTRLVFLRQTPGAPNPGSLFVVNVDGTGLRQITPDGFNVQCCGNHRWSPDGKRILFADTMGALWLVNPDGTGLTKFFSDTQGRFAITPAWSPDGTRVMFALDPTADPFAHPANGLYVINTDGTALTLVIGTPDFKREPEWLP
ncbi:WD40 repeat protein [Kribbella sp. VKM Ac-2527]|uniref:WD40 repeat protein n=1 Tax=Kribbella caucasensis TaxID=2512215 RepID=A0A4R6IYK4_9ACTN|nr:PD40 domain-containing protein [Kribbella sp. VKM Ac-2527]TDO27517.1 WD40 repeat protein [Kribbella sp. VKM Ac-2527]